MDLVQSTRSKQAVYINQGDGTGWTEDTGYSIPTYFWDTGDIMMDVVSLVDMNGDKLPDIIYSADSSTENAVYINKGDGTGWEEDTAYTVPLSFAYSYGDPAGVQIFDINGDGMLDFIQSRSTSSGSSQKVYLNKSSPLLLTGIEQSKGSSLSIKYAASTAFDNSELPFVLQVVSTVTSEDGLGGSSTVSYDYSGGAYLYEDEFNRQFAAFETVIKTEEGRVTKIYYPQDEFAKLGHPYKTEIYDEHGSLYLRQMDTWETSDLGYGNTFVYKSQSVNMSYDGASSHRDIGTAYTYDSYGNMKKVIHYGEVRADEEGDFTDVSEIDEYYAVTNTYATDSKGKIRGKLSEQKITNSEGETLQKTRYFYDGLGINKVTKGNLTKQAQWNNVSDSWNNTSYAYNSYGLLNSIKDPNGHTTSMTYNDYKLYPGKITNAKGYTVSLQYDYASGQVTQKTDENGFISKTSYDGLGRVLKVSVPDPTTGTTTKLSSTTYDDTSFPNSSTTVTTVAGVNNKSVTYFDGFGRTIQTNTLAEEGVYNTVDNWYDELGNTVQQSLPYQTSSSVYGRDVSQYSVTTNYDVLNRPLTITSPTGSTMTSYAQWESTVTDANGISKIYHYDAAGHLVEVVEDNEGETYTTTYDYDPIGQLLTLTDAQENERNFTYDSLGRKISQEDLHDVSVSDFGTWIYAYDKVSNLLTQTDPAGQVITWEYDSLNRVVSEDWDATEALDIDYDYDASTNGKMRLYQVKLSEYYVRYNSYDALGNVTQETRFIQKPESSDYNSYRFKSTYDLLSRPIQLIYPSSALTVNYTYNATGALEKITRGVGGSTDVVSDFDYSPMRQVSSITYGNGVTTTNTYDPAESYRLTDKTTTGMYDPAFMSSTWSAVQNLSYNYDAVGNITSIIDASSTPTAKAISYAYDDLNRLLSATTSGLSVGDYSETYTYDSVGNLTYKSDVGDLLYEGTGVDGANPHAVTSVAGTSYTYDANGNLTSNGAHSYTWDARNRLVSSGSLNFSYDHTGSRYKTIDSSSGTPVYTYYLSPYEEVRNGIPTYYIFAGGQRVAALENNALTYYHQDHLGGTALTTNLSGYVTQIYDYYPYGSELLNSALGATDAIHSFTDKEYEEDIGLYYFEARWYDSEIGRFSSQDPAQLDNRVFKLLQDPQSLNFYAYSRNNPVNFVDPSGEFAIAIPYYIYIAAAALLAMATVNLTIQVQDIPDSSIFDTPPAIEQETQTSFPGETINPGLTTVNIPYDGSTSPYITVPVAGGIQSNVMTSRSYDNIFDGATLTEDKGKTKNWISGTSGYDTALKDFQNAVAADGGEIKYSSEGVPYYQFKDGTSGSVYEKATSTGGPTIQVNNTDGTNDKIRY